VERTKPQGQKKKAKGTAGKIKGNARTPSTREEFLLESRCPSGVKGVVGMALWEGARYRGENR